MVALVLQPPAQKVRIPEQILYHMVLSVMSKLITIVVIATVPGLSVFWVFTATFLK